MPAALSVLAGIAALTVTSPSTLVGPEGTIGSMSRNVATVAASPGTGASPVGVSAGVVSTLCTFVPAGKSISTESMSASATATVALVPVTFALLDEVSRLRFTSSTVPSDQVTGVPPAAGSTVSAGTRPKLPLRKNCTGSPSLPG